MRQIMSLEKMYVHPRQEAASVRQIPKAAAEESTQQQHKKSNYVRDLLQAPASDDKEVPQLLLCDSIRHSIDFTLYAVLAFRYTLSLALLNTP